jgi:eukaryotic-like serine/threonine-protein kinase
MLHPTRVCPECAKPAGAEATSCPDCGTSLLSVALVDLVDGRYAMEQELGRGGMGVVYRARDLGLDREVALKLVPPSREPAPHRVSRLRKEAAALARVRNEHVVSVYAFGSHGDSFFFAMEYIRGIDLARIIDEHSLHHTLLPLSRAVSILRAVANGLEAAHEAGLIHGDVKPENIVIEERTGRPVLIDFGLARAPSEQGVHDVGAGTPDYMAPEQVSPGQAWGVASPKSDIYALGCTAYEMLTGRLPFAGETVTEVLQAQCTRSPEAPSTVRPALGDFDALIARALSKSPDARYGRVSEFAAALEEALDKTMQAEPTEPVLAPLAQVEEIAGEGDARSLEILVVDDDVVFRRLATRCVQLALYRRPIRVRVVASGDAAVACAMQTLPDLILLDYFMPGMTGIDTLTKIRDLPGASRTRVLVVSGSIGRVERWRFGVLGVRDFVEKPIAMPEFVSLVFEIARDAGWISERDSPM